MNQESKTATWRDPWGPYLDQKGFVDARRPRRLYSQEAVAERLPTIDPNQKQEGAAGAEIPKRGGSVEGSPDRASNTGVFGESIFDKQANWDSNSEISDKEDYLNMEDSPEEDGWEII